MALMTPIALGLAVVAVAILAGRREHRRRRAEERQARAQASSPPFDVFHVGAVFEGLAMNEAVRAHIAPDREFPEDQRRDNVTYLYGSARPRPRARLARAFSATGVACRRLRCRARRCARSTRACTAIGSIAPRRATTIKDVPAASFDGGRILEIYTANTTITIYGDGPELVLRAAQALRRAGPMNIPAGVQPLYALSPATERVPCTLPPPGPEVLAQTEPCR